MAARKDKPTLIELINKKDALSTPPWFYGKKKNRPQAVGDDTKVISPPADIPVRQTSVVEIPAPEITYQSGQNPKTSWFVLSEGRVTLSLSYWIIPIIVMALILALLIAYRLGQSGSQVSSSPYEELPPSSKLQEAINQPVREGLLPVNTTDTASTSPTAQTNRAEFNTTPTLASPAVSMTPTESSIDTEISQLSGNCLVMCGAQDRAVLEPVQRFFNDNGIPSLIKRFENRYVLVSTKTVESRSSSDAQSFQQRVAELGIKGVPSFSKAFHTMHWVGVDKIK
ncbi:MAG: hypothetical protein JW860_15500 [Sedimentisphaerales bacterium]|nr:hypothetical protein [Sedimentisphaerales bacterium]